MLRTQRIKKTGEIVHVIGKADSGHSYVLFTFATKTRAGNWGNVQLVCNDNLQDSGDEI